MLKKDLCSIKKLTNTKKEKNILRIEDINSINGYNEILIFDELEFNNFDLKQILLFRLLSQVLSFTE